jgi:hypothetical protein
LASLWTPRSGRGWEPKLAIGSVLRAESLLARRYQALFALREGRQLVFDGQPVHTVGAVGVYSLEQSFLQADAGQIRQREVRRLGWAVARAQTDQKGRLSRRLVAALAVGVSQCRDLPAQ